MQFQSDMIGIRSGILMSGGGCEMGDQTAADCTRTSSVKTKARDMTKGPILRQLILFALPLFFGNVFQQFYSTVDSVVVGNFVSADALAAVTMTGSAVNTLVGLFMGMSTGASVVISHCFGRRDRAGLRKAVHTALFATFLLGLFMMVVGVGITPTLLRFMQTPESIVPLASVYLRIYFLGIEGLMFYNNLGDSPRGRRFEEASSVPDYHKPPERGTGSSVRPVFSAWRCRGCLCDDSVAVRIGISGAVCVIPEHGGLWNFLPGNAN